MSTKHGSRSEQARRRLAAGDLILRGFDNDEIVQILEVSFAYFGFRIVFSPFRADCTGTKPLSAKTQVQRIVRLNDNNFVTFRFF